MRRYSCPEIRFVLAAGQNYFFVELAEALCSELRAQGSVAHVTVGEPPEVSREVVNVFLPPHEYVALAGYRLPEGLLRRSVTISAEQPSSGFFATNLELARDAGAVFDINRRAVREYHRNGIVSARHLQLGYTPDWDAVLPDRAAKRRDIDIVFMGRVTGRRARALASYADVFERFRCHLQLSDGGRPNLPTAPDFVAADVKRRLLGRAEILLSIHGEEEPYFEQLRAVEAMCAGCVVVSERSSDMAPFRVGEHLLTGSIDNLGLLCSALLADRERLTTMQRAAYEFVRSEVPLAGAAREVAEVAASLAELPITPGTGDQLMARHIVAMHRGAVQFEYQPPASLHSPVEGQVLRTLKRQEQALMSLRREISRVCRSAASPGQEILIRYESPAWSVPERALTVVVPLYNHAGSILETLESVERADPDGHAAIIVVNDGSTDHGGSLAVDWMTAHESRACRVVEHAVNRGLPAARNTGASLAVGEFLLMLDADNMLRRHAIDRLTAALRSDPGASFAYGILERFSYEGPEGLVSVFPWEPERLRQGNYIDALALVRRTALEALGGYSQDPRLHGWEDYDLWVRIAEQGGHGAFVPEIIARYRTSHTSMISITNVSVSDALATVAERAPVLMRGLRVPH